MSEINIAAKWIYTLLSSDPTISNIVGTRIYRSVAPQGATMPCIVFQLQSPGNDLVGTGAIRIWNTSTWVVKAIGNTASYAGNLETLANRIDALLHGESSEVDGGYCWCIRLRPFELAETADGVNFRHLGGAYRITTQAQ